MTPLLAVSDVVWQALIAAVATVVLAWMNQRTRKAVTDTAASAAGHAAEVKTTLEAATGEQNAKLDDIHTLVNNRMAVQLQMTADLARWKADQTHDPEDVRRADLAEDLYREHQAKQATVDAQAKRG